MARGSHAFDIITIGSAVQDIFLFLREEDILILDNPRHEITRKKLLALEYGAKFNVSKSAQTLGGGALNSAVCFSRLGLKTASLVSLGCDESAEAILADLRREKIALNFVNYHSTLPTGFSTLLVAGRERERVAIVERGANDLLDFNPNKRGITSAKWYYASTLSGAHWDKVLDKIAGAVQSKKISWAWNPGAEQLEHGIGALGRWLKHCAVFMVNRDEALGLLESEHAREPRRHDIKYLLTTLLEWGPKKVIITDGPDGAYYADSEQMLFIPSNEKIMVVESTGAGDAFGSGFVAGLMLTKDANIPYALSLAMSNSESVIQKVGAQEGLLKKTQLKNIGKYKIQEIK